MKKNTLKKFENISHCIDIQKIILKRNIVKNQYKLFFSGSDSSNKIRNIINQVSNLKNRVFNDLEVYKVKTLKLESSLKKII